MTTQVAEKLYTLDEYLALPDNADYELVDGRLVEMSGTSIEHNDVVDNLYRPLTNYVWNKKLGRVVVEGVFSYDPVRPNNSRRPDLAFVSAERRAGQDRSTNYTIAPDLAVEVVSPTDVMRDVEAKVAEYRRFGVRLIWVISPTSESVFIYHAADPRVVVKIAGDELSGEDVVPGFRMRVADLFVTEGQSVTGGNSVATDS